MNDFNCCNVNKHYYIAAQSPVNLYKMWGTFWNWPEPDKRVNKITSKTP